MPEKTTGVPPAPDHLDPEVLAAYVDRTLTPDERAKAEAHFAACEECYELLAEVMRTDEAMASQSPQVPGVPRVQVPPAPQVSQVREAGSSGVALPKAALTNEGAPSAHVLKPTFGRRRLWIGVGGVLAAAAAILLVMRTQPAWFGRTSQPPSIERLVQSVGEQPLLATQLSGGFKYLPGELRTRSGVDQTPQNLALLAAAGEIQRAVESDPTPENLHAWGVAQTLLGRYDEAVKALESALGQDTDNARIHNDISVAYASRAEGVGRTDDWPRALAAADRAHRLNASLPQPLFNRAVALTGLNLRSEAQKAWNEYLAVDPTSPWAIDARRQLDRLSQPRPGSKWLDDRNQLLVAALHNDSPVLEALVRAYREQVRSLVEDELLPQWGRAVTKDPAAADRLLQQAFAITTAKAWSDPLLRESIRQLTATPEPSYRRTIAAGLVAYGEARALYESNRIVDSATPFEQAKRSLTAVSSPMWLWCELHLAIVRYYAGDLAATRASTDRLARTAQQAGYSALQARARWMTGLTATVRADYSEQLTAYEEALGLFEGIGESENAAAIHNLLAGTYQYLGDERQVWRHVVIALRASGALTVPRRYHTYLVSTATRAIKWGYPEVALFAANEALRFAETWAAPEGFVEGYRYRALAYAALDDYSASSAAAAEARRRLGDIRDPLLNRRLSAELAALEAEVLVAKDPARAFSAADEAIEFFSKSSLTLRIPRVRMAQGRARLAMGNTAGAVESFQSGIELLEREHVSVPANGSTRISHADEVWSMYRDLFSALLESGAPDEKLLALAERGRARTLNERTGGQTENGWIDQLQAGLGPDRAVVYFVQLARQTIIWTITAGAMQTVRVAVPEEDLERDVSQMADGLSARQIRSWQSASERLSHQLFGKLNLSALSVSQLIIVPDGFLARVPFSALRDPSRKTYFVEQFTISVAPSAGFLLASWRSERRLDATSKVLAIANGREVSEEGLRPLPAAAEEVTAIAQLFPNTIAISDADATWENLQKHVGIVDVVHFAGHTVANREYPELSRFYLSTSSGQARAVFARDLAALSLDNVSVMVLASCSSLDGAVSSTEGLLGLGRAFLAEGVKSIVASRWDVGDAATTDLVSRFYRHLRTEPPAVALASASRELIRSGRESEWAAWVLVGG